MSAGTPPGTPPEATDAQPLAGGAGEQPLTNRAGEQPLAGREGEQPLAGVRVIDLTRILSGPFCAMLLGDLGADVVKIEPPGRGDHIRGQGAIVDGLSWYFASFNRNKRSLTLDLRAPEGRAVLERLLADADVLTENFRPGVLDEMGLTKARLEEINPRLVVASVNGYGSEGPYRDRPAFDFIAQAMSGFMATNGTAETGPMRAAAPLTDLIAGLYAALGTVSALHARETTGAGQRVEASMMMSTMSMLAYLTASQLATGAPLAPSGNDHPVASPYGLFHAADGPVAVAPSTTPVLRRFLGELGLEALLDDPRFDTNAKRVERRAELGAMIDERMGADTQANWIARLNRAGVPCGRVQSLAEALDDPQVAAQEMVLDVDHPGHGRVRMTGFPLKLSATPCRLRRPAPDLGADTDAVLAEAGYDAETIAHLRTAGIV
ncbi:MAG: CaiB/BaiF CoA transferase family protein [Paracoccaceae bacterium]